MGIKMPEEVCESQVLGLCLRPRAPELRFEGTGRPPGPQTAEGEGEEM